MSTINAATAGIDLEHLADLVADRLAPRLAEQLSGTGRRRAFVGVPDLADLLGCSRDFVYQHATELGALRIGTGPRAALRFDLDLALESMRDREQPPEPEPDRAGPRRRKRSPRAGHTSGGAALLTYDRRAA